MFALAVCWGKLQDYFLRRTQCVVLNQLSHDCSATCFRIPEECSYARAAKLKRSDMFSKLCSWYCVCCWLFVSITWVICSVFHVEWMPLVLFTCVWCTQCWGQTWSSAGISWRTQFETYQTNGVIQLIAMR